MILYYSGAPDNTAVPEAVLGTAPVMLTYYDLYQKKKLPKRWRRHARGRDKKRNKK